MQMSDSHPSPAERRSPRRPRANLRKLMFVLPNLFTVSSIFCGVYSITLSAGEPTGDNFYRLPIPLAAGMLVSLVIALNNIESPVAEAVGLWPIATLVLALAFLMVSTIRYRTFKEAGLNSRTVLVFLLVTAVGVAVAIRGRPSLVLLVYFSFYILLGLAEEALFGRRRRAAARAAQAAVRLPEPEEPLLPAEEDEVPLENAAAATAGGGSGDEGESDA